MNMNMNIKGDVKVQCSMAQTPRKQRVKNEPW